MRCGCNRGPGQNRPPRRFENCWRGRRSGSKSIALIPIEPAALVDAADIGAEVALDPNGLSITVPAGTGRDVVAEINRLLVVGGAPVYGIYEVQASLESWFLQVTSRLGEPQ